MRHLYESRAKRALVAAMMGSLVPGYALAQESGGTVLEEILVTAQKREERLLDVPIAISAFTDDALTDAGAVQLADFLQTAPGVGIVDNQSGTQNIQIRGVNSTFGDAPVGYYLDELPFSLIGNTQVPDVRTYDIQRVEVLRGPQGTLYGDGSIGGTIRILTHEPNLETFEGSAEVMGSTITDGGDNYAVKGMLNMPFAEGTAGFRLVASVEEFGGWIDNTTTGVSDQNERDVNNFRGKFRWMPTDRLDIVLSAWRMEQDGTGDANSLADRTVADLGAADYETEYDLLSATIRYSFDSVDLVSATSSMDFTGNSTTLIAGLFPFEDLTSQDILSQEFRLASTGSDTFRWTGGFFFRSMERQTFSALPDFGFTQDLALDSDAWAVFGELTWTLLDQKLDLTLGLRYFEDDRLLVEGVDPTLLAIIQSIDPSYDGRVDEKFDSTNPRLNIAFRPTENWMVYGNVAKGFRTGQPQPAISLGLAILNGVEIPTGIDPEELWSYEVGTKGTFADGSASFEATVFYNDWDQLQVPVLIANSVNALVNAGAAETTGIEAAVTFVPIENLELRFGGGYTNAEFAESVEGININKGDKIPNVPETTLFAGGTWRWPWFGSTQGFLNGNVQYAGERTDTVSGSFPSDTTTTLGLRFGLEGDVWGAYLVGDNLTDEDGAISPQPVGLAGPTGPAAPATRFRPRTVGLQVRVSF